MILFSLPKRSALSCMGFVLLILAGCASRGGLDYQDSASRSAAPLASVSSIFVATNRQANLDDARILYGSQRSKQLGYARFDVSIPGTHKIGEIEWPSGQADPAKHFVTRGHHDYSDAHSFHKAVSDHSLQKAERSPTGQKELVLYIHGYNTNFAEGLYRVAQIQHDYDMTVPMMLFSWPSAGRTGLYVYDRDSVKISRDALVQVIEQLHRSNIEQITLVAHSLGSELLMESLRQMHLSGKASFLSKLNGVILLSPDLDLDVFNAQLNQIKPLPRPFFIFASQKDEALQVSGLLTGQEERVGNSVDLSKINHSGISVVDVTDFTGGDRLHHSTVATSPALVTLLKGLKQQNPLDALQTSANQQTIGARVVGTATLPLRILTKTTEAVFAP